MWVFMLSEKMIFKEMLTSRITSLFFVLHLFSEIGETIACKGYFVRGKDYQIRGLIVHNMLRKRHGAPEMELTDELNWKADKCAKHYARKGKIDHDCPYIKKLGIGENLWWHSGTENVNPVDCANSAIQGFYSEIEGWNFTYSNGSAGHFTQSIWDTSTELGIGFALHKTGGSYIVALYKEHGNMVGEYAEHVLPPKGPTPKFREFGKNSQSGRITRWDIMIILWALTILRCQHYI